MTDIFTGLGLVHPVGSYRLDVMYRPDIDLIVTADRLDRGAAITVTKRMLDLEHFQTVGFADWDSYDDPSGAKGFYWDLRTFRGDDWWKLDVWYTKPEDGRSIEPAEQFAQLLQVNPTARRTILDIKAHCFDGMKYCNGLTGLAIYAAVLNHGRTTVESVLRAWNAERIPGEGT